MLIFLSKCLVNCWKSYTFAVDKQKQRDNEHVERLLLRLLFLLCSNLWSGRPYVRKNIQKIKKYSPASQTSESGISFKDINKV